MYAVGMLCRAMSCPTEATLVLLDSGYATVYYSTLIGIAMWAYVRLYGMSDSDWAVKHYIWLGLQLYVRGYQLGIKKAASGGIVVL